MSELEIWTVGWLIGAVVVLIAAALLIWILLVARSLEHHTARALRALQAVERNTKPIWRLSETAEGLEHVRSSTVAIGAALARLAPLRGGASKERPST